MDGFYDKNRWCVVCHRPNHDGLPRCEASPPPIVFDIGHEAHLAASPDSIRLAPPLDIDFDRPPSIKTLYDSLCRLASHLSTYEEHIKHRDDLMVQQYNMVVEWETNPGDSSELLLPQDRARTDKYARILNLKGWVETIYKDVVYDPMCRHIRSLPVLATENPNVSKEYVSRVLIAGYDPPKPKNVVQRCHELLNYDFRMAEINQPLMDKVEALCNDNPRMDEAQELYNDNVARIFGLLEKFRLMENDESWDSFERFEWPDLRYLTTWMRYPDGDQLRGLQNGGF
ncbi:uncharacterized protein AB675_4891 [Cyphellophora attinorum]|uniref:Uncharacterized protein n=1 Tax=Cyphellophora attinorum TaxID=1664694 RepID=A0A0N0NHB5_9EURO|nr:uncharacterized protein AB675_4891 [Phialophora attinorum]KPI34368.1 hypothetical protein AB675_4891 [Phialophora attinorum]